MTRIALVCDWYAPRRGGIEAHLEGLASRLVKFGHEVHVITSTPGPRDSIDGVRVHRLAARRLPLADVVAQPGFVSEISAILAAGRIELVHAHVSIVSPVALGGAVAAERLRLPSVLTFHSFVPATRLWAGLTGWLLRANRWNASMTAVSGRVLREVSPFAPGHRFTVLPNAIDLEFWTPGAMTEHAPLTLTYVGRLHSKKKPMRALRSAAALRRAHPGLDFRLVLCGSGPEESHLRQYAAREGLAGLVEFRGWQDAFALRDALRSTDVFLSTADRESFGIAALEARAVGVPVVAMRDSGVSDFVADGESGMLASSDADFTDAVQRLATDRDLRDAMRDHNRRVPPAQGWDASLRAHAAVYSRALSGKTQAS